MANAKKKAAPPVRERTMKFGVPELAKYLDIQEASVRVALRKHDIPKNDGNSYGWNTREEMEKVGDKISGDNAGATKKAKPAAAKKAVAKKKAAR